MAYDDGRVACTDRELIIRRYYVLGGAKRIRATVSAYRSRVSPGPGAATADRMSPAISPCRYSCV